MWGYKGVGGGRCQRWSFRATHHWAILPSGRAANIAKKSRRKDVHQVSHPIDGHPSAGIRGGATLHTSAEPERSRRVIVEGEKNEAIGAGKGVGKEKRILLVIIPP